MKDTTIISILYTEFDDSTPKQVSLFLSTSDISSNIRALIEKKLYFFIKSKKSITINEPFIPKSLLLLSLPSLNVKGIVKHIEKPDSSRHEGIAQSAITLLYNEVDDIIIYKYAKDIESNFNVLAKKINNFREIKEDIGVIREEMEDFHLSIVTKLNNLQTKESSMTQTKVLEESIEKEPDYKFKIIFCGNSSVGKTSIILRFTDNTFNRSYLPTMGVNISNKKVTINDNIVQFVIWDIAGQSKFETMRKHFFRGFDGAFIVFDLTDSDALNSVQKWYQDLMHHLDENQNFVGFFLGNKNDLKNQRNVNKEEAVNLSRKNNISYIETSALTGDNVENSFYKIAEKLIFNTKG
jgi:small GTP-binding protein